MSAGCSWFTFELNASLELLLQWGSEVLRNSLPSCKLQVSKAHQVSLTLPVPPRGAARGGLGATEEFKVHRLYSLETHLPGSRRRVRLLGCARILSCLGAGFGRGFSATRWALNHAWLNPFKPKHAGGAAAPSDPNASQHLLHVFRGAARGMRCVSRCSRTRRCLRRRRPRWPRRTPCRHPRRGPSKRKRRGAGEGRYISQWRGPAWETARGWRVENSGF